jgi:hypothetical protein
MNLSFWVPSNRLGVFLKLKVPKPLNFNFI